MTREYKRDFFNCQIKLENLANGIVVIEDKIDWSNTEATIKTIHLDPTGARLLLEILQEYFAEVDKNKSNPSRECQSGE